MKFIQYAAAALFTLVFIGCGEALPEVNDANCQFDEIMKIKDQATREKFGGLCARRGITPKKA